MHQPGQVLGRIERVGEVHQDLPPTPLVEHLLLGDQETPRAGTSSERWPLVRCPDRLPVPFDQDRLSLALAVQLRDGEVMLEAGVTPLQRQAFARGSSR